MRRHGGRLVSNSAEFGFAKLRKLKIRMDADFQQRKRL
jgi:hypothetical protein